MSVDVELVKQVITRHDRSRPRSQQTHIGPSEIGGDCLRRLGYTLAGVQPTNPRGLQLPSWIGTAAHEQMSQALANDRDWLTDVRVWLPGTESLTSTGQPISGTLDAYHRPSRTVVDWKFLADSTIRKVAALGQVSNQYRTQVHLYAYGLIGDGTGDLVDDVAVAFIPRSGNPRLLHVWTEPYDQQVAGDALDRLRNVATVARGGLLADLPTAEQFCTGCPFYLPASTEWHQACPGHHEPSTPTVDGTNPTQEGNNT